MGYANARGHKRTSLYPWVWTFMGGTVGAKLLQVLLGIHPHRPITISGTFVGLAPPLPQPLALAPALAVRRRPALLKPGAASPWPHGEKVAALQGRSQFDIGYWSNGHVNLQRWCCSGFFKSNSSSFICANTSQLKWSCLPATLWLWLLSDIPLRICFLSFLCLLCLDPIGCLQRSTRVKS